MSSALLETLGLEKSYGATRAAQDVSLAFEAGKVHALVGADLADEGVHLARLEGEAHVLRRPRRAVGLLEAERFQQGRAHGRFLFPWTKKGPAGGESPAGPSLNFITSSPGR